MIINVKSATWVALIASVDTIAVPKLPDISSYSAVPFRLFNIPRYTPDL